MKKCSLFVRTLCALIASSGALNAQLTLGADFAAEYQARSLGSVPGLPTSYGGLTIHPSNPDVLIIGGAANTASGRLYSVQLIRDAEGHITGFNGNAVQFGEVGEYNDGGVAFGPTGVLFTARWPNNELGQTLPDGTDEARVDNVATLGIGGSSIAALNFVPPGFAGAGKLKVVSWNSGNWYDLNIAPDGNGTFDLVSATQIDLNEATPAIDVVPGGPEGFVYIDSSNKGFTKDSLLVAEWSAGRLGAYEMDSEGNPLVATRRDFLIGLTGAEGALIDPVTGDFLFSTFGGGDQIVVISGFERPKPTLSECDVVFSSTKAGKVSLAVNSTSTYKLQRSIDKLEWSGVESKVATTEQVEFSYDPETEPQESPVFRIVEDSLSN